MCRQLAAFTPFCQPLCGPRALPHQHGEVVGRGNPDPGRGSAFVSRRREGVIEATAARQTHRVGAIGRHVAPAHRVHETNTGPRARRRSRRGVGKGACVSHTGAGDGVSGLLPPKRGTRRLGGWQGWSCTARTRTWRRGPLGHGDGARNAPCFSRPHTRSRSTGKVPHAHSPSPHPSASLCDHSLEPSRHEEQVNK